MLLTEEIDRALVDCQEEVPIQDLSRVLRRSGGLAALDRVLRWTKETGRVAIPKSEVIALLTSLETDLAEVFAYVGRRLERMDRLEREVASALRREVRSCTPTEILDLRTRHPECSGLLTEYAHTLAVCRALVDRLNEYVAMYGNLVLTARPFQFNVRDYLEACGEAPPVPDPYVPEDDDL